MDINDERIKRKTLQIKNNIDLLNDKYYTWLRNIITLAVGFFGIIISLKSNHIQNTLQHFFFILALSSLALGIFSGTIVLYSEISILSKIKDENIKNMIKMLNDEKIERVTRIERGLKYKIAEYFCFCSFVISLLSLVLYANFTN
jgi:hypothetical protein